MCIERKIAKWDGKSAGYIKAVYASHKEDNHFPIKILSMLEHAPLELGATWLLKAWLESGNRLDSKQVKKVYRSLSNFEHWGARLHVLQSMPFMPIGRPECEKVYNFLKNNLSDTNKFVRAWTYNGFYELARQYPEYVDKTKKYFELAMKDEAASVKARIRNLLKKGF